MSPDPPTRAAVAADGLRRLPLSWVGAIPYLAVVGLFLVLPVAVNVWSSFHANGELSVQNLIDATKGQYRNAFLETIYLSAITAVLGGLLGMVIAWALAGRVAGPKMFKTLANAFTTVSSQAGGVPLAFAFVATLGAEGLITKLIFDATGFQLTDHFRLATFWGLTLVYLYFQVPLMAILMVPAFQGLRVEWQEAALALGANRWHFLRQIAIPIMSPAVVGSLLLLFANAFAAYATAYALAGSRVNLVSIQIGFFLSGNVLFDESFAAALVTWMMVIICVCLGLRGLLMRRATRWLR